MESLTARQSEIFQYICNYIQLQAIPPTFREIAEAFSIRSTNGVKELLNSIAKKGYLRLIPRVSRGIQVVAQTPSAKHTDQQAESTTHQIPLLGSIAAGSPILTETTHNEWLAIDKSMCRDPKSVFALKVRGDSMIGAGILNGDIVIVSVIHHEPKPGTIVAAIVGNEATVKRFFKEKECVKLMPENDKFAPIIITSESPEFRIAGQVIGLIRKY